MIDKEILQRIEREAKEFFAKLQAEASLSVKEEDDAVLVEVNMSEPQLFIGERGQTLMEIQHVFRMILRKKFQEQTLVFLDVNEYKKSKEAYLKELARNTADEVSLLKKEKELPAMNSAERRIVHVELQGRTDVSSESIGEEPERRIVIKPK